jgi:NDP-sugar pyrophosphorylase family protein
MVGPEWGKYERGQIEQAFDRVEGLPNDPHTPRHFFIEEVKGELYPIPRTLYGVDLGDKPIDQDSEKRKQASDERRDDYSLRENGALISTSAEVDVSAVLGPRTEIESGAKVKGTAVLGRRVRIARGAKVYRSLIQDHSIVEKEARVDGSSIDSETIIEDLSKVVNSIVGKGVVVSTSSAIIDSEIGARSRISRSTIVKESILGIGTGVGEQGLLRYADTRNNVNIGDNARIYHARLKSGVKVGDCVHIGKPRRSLAKTTLQTGVRVIDGTFIRGGRKFKEGTVVVPYDHEISRGQKSASRVKIKRGNKPRSKTA